VTGTLPLVELGAVCAELRAANLDLFERLGAWVTTTEDGVLQRLFATACHRHAWQAEVWLDRAPTIPVVDVDAATATWRRPLPDPSDAGGRAAAYADALAKLGERLANVAGGVDGELDPSTARVLALSRADVDDLAGRLSAVGASR
jgi:hypothetical protein